MRAGFRLLSPTQGAEDEAAADAADAATRRCSTPSPPRTPTASISCRWASIPRIPTSSPPPTATTASSSTTRTGNPLTVVTQGRRYHRAILADTIRTFPTREKPLAVYRQLWAFAHEHLDPNLPSPDDMAGASTEELAAMNRSISGESNMAEQRPRTRARSIPGVVSLALLNEIGSGDGTDGSGYCKHTPGGLYNTATWPLKYFDTCVKNQANRGACVAFATTAGREMRVAQKYDRWMNLSEQHLYFMAKRVYQPAEYGDGLGASTLLGQLFTANYEQPLEQQWDYNPSNSRTDDEKNENPRCRAPATAVPSRPSAPTPRTRAASSACSRGRTSSAG